MGVNRANSLISIVGVEYRHARQIVAFKNGSARRSTVRIDDSIGDVIIRAAFRYFIQHGCEVWIFPYKGHGVVDGIDPAFLHHVTGALVVGEMDRATSQFDEMPLPMTLVSPGTELVCVPGMRSKFKLPCDPDCAAISEVVACGASV